MDLPEIPNVEHFLSMIENRPALWDRSNRVYTIRIVRERNWREIMKDMYPDFTGWDKRRQLNSIRLVIKRWTQMRDSYIKSERKRLASQNSKVLGRPVRPYRYHREMQFLKTVVQFQDTTPNNKQKNNADNDNLNETDNSGDFDNTELIIDPEDKIGYGNESIKIENENSNYFCDGQDEVFNDSDSCVDEPIQPKRRKTTDEHISSSPPIIDSGGQTRHMLFFRGIIPSLDNLDEDQILEFQIGVLKLIKQIKNIT